MGFILAFACIYIYCGYDVALPSWNESSCYYLQAIPQDQAYGHTLSELGRTTWVFPWDYRNLLLSAPPLQWQESCLPHVVLGYYST